MTEFNNLVIIDANFILVPIQFKLDYLDEINFRLEGKTKFLVYQQVLDELEAKAQRFERQQKSARFEAQLKAGKTYLERNKDKYHIRCSSDIKDKVETTDEFLLRKIESLKEKYPHIYLATNDRYLRRRAKKNASIILIRQNKTLSIR